MAAKRGLSDIVTNVLIILLVLVAIGIVWRFVLPSIKGGAQQVASGSDCLTLSLEPQSCKIHRDANECRGQFSPCYDVQVKRKAGNANLKEVRYLFELSDGNTASATNSTISELATMTTRVILPQLPTSAVTFVSVAGVVDAPNGGQLCAQTTKISCT